MAPFEIKVVDKSEWTNHAGRKAEPVDESLIQVVRDGYRDGKTRAVVLPNEEIEKVVGQLRKASKIVDCTVTTQKKEDQPGYTKLLIKVGNRIYRARKSN